MGILLKSRSQKWGVLIICGVVVLLLDTVFQYNVLSSIFKDSKQPPHGERKHGEIELQSSRPKQTDIKIHPRRLQEVEDMFFEAELKKQIDFLSGQLNLSNFYTPEPELQTDFTLTELFLLDQIQKAPEEDINADQRPRHILFNSYIRGGSSILVDMVSKQQDAFYFPEPLWTITPFGYFTADNYICSSKTGYCRPLKKNRDDSSGSRPDEEMRTMLKYSRRKEFPLDTALRILQNIFTCHFDEHFDTLPIEDLPYSDLGHVLRRYIECRKNGLKGNCLSALSSMCKEHKVRVAKVLRLTLASVENFLQINKGVKVVHMFRDPRAIISSRLYNADWYHLHKTSRNPTITENARALCQKMILDYRSGTRLMQLFPDRFVFTRYEDLTSSRKANAQLENLLHFLKIKLDMSKLETYKNRFDWRNLMSVKDIGLVDDECRDIYHKLGYLALNEDRLIRNFKVESFVSV